MKKARFLSIFVTFIILLAFPSASVQAVQLKIKDINIVNGESTCRLIITRENNGKVNIKDFDLTYSMNGEREEPLRILGFETGHKTVTITAPAFKATVVSNILL